MHEPSLQKPHFLPVCRVLLLLHLGLAVVAWWLLPHGFPPSHVRFWINSVLPWVVVAVCAAALVQQRRGRVALFQDTVIGITIGWTILPVAAWFTFPITGYRFLPIFWAALGMWLICGVAFRKTFRIGWRTGLAAVLATALAIALPVSQAGPEASTKTIVTVIPAPAGGESFEPQPMERLAENGMVHPHSGSLVVDCGLKVHLEPLLAFHDFSPDRNWSIFSPPELRMPGQRLLGGRRHGEAQIYEYQPLGEIMAVTFDPARSATRLQTWAKLKEPIYSHLNSFSVLTITGHERLFLSFSPCPSQHIEALPADYPTGRPAQCAYLDADGTFHVVRARSGEKGPFTELGRGPLAASDPLVITLFNGDEPVCRISFANWAAQASTELSPTAGWGLPQNSIEFQRQGDSNGSLVNIWLSLAGTSVGRGWDTIGHAAGVYVNEVIIEPVE